MPMSFAKRRYTVAILLSSLGYAAALFGAIGYFQNHPASRSAAAYIAAVVPALLIMCMFAAIGRYLVEERDEYLRMLMVRQTLWASGFALSIATIWGFLESFGLVGHVESYYVAVLWFGGLGLGACANKLSFGNAGGRGA